MNNKNKSTALAKTLKRSNSIDSNCFLALKGRPVNSTGQTTTEGHHLLMDRVFSRPRLSAVQSATPLSDGMARINNRWFSYLVLILLGVGYSFNGYCQPADSLSAYLEISVKNNPQVLQRYAEYEAALHKVPQVAGLPDPELSVGFFLSPMEIISGKQIADIRLMQMFPWFGVLRNAKDEMSLMANAKYESFRDAKIQLSFEVMQTWYDMVSTKQNIAVATKNTELLQTIERLALTGYKSASTSAFSIPTGNSMPQQENTVSAASAMNSMNNQASSQANNSPAPMNSSPMESSASATNLSDIYQIRIKIAENENNIESLKSQLNTLTIQFNRLLNRPFSSGVSLPDTLVAVPFQLSSIPDRLISQHPMLAMIGYEQQSLDARGKMTQRMSYPMVGVGINYSVVGKSEMSTSAMNGSDMIMPMVTATLPIYRKKYRAAIDEVASLKKANELNYQNTANSLRAEYLQAVQQYRDALRTINLYDQQSLLARKSLSVLIKSFASAGTGLTELLQVEQQLLDYQSQKIESIARYNKTVANLKRLTVFTSID